jgi:hypothetical protein
VLSASQKGGEALGQASYPTPGQLVVSAPAAMHDSISEAITQLSGDATAVASAGTAAAAIELWVVGVDAGAGSDDAALAPAKEALDEARSRFALGRFQLMDRAMAVSAMDGSPLQIETDTLHSSWRLNVASGGTIRAAINLNLREGQDSYARFGSTLMLRDREWQVVGMLTGNEVAAPNRLLLVRATRSSNASADSP